MRTTRMPIRVMLVDDHVLFRKGVEALLTAHEDFDVVGEASNGKEAVEKVGMCKPDVILMDIDMPVCSGLDAVKMIKSEMPHVHIVMLTVSDDDQDLFKAVKNGAGGYLLKNLEPKDLYEMLHGILRGEAPITGIMASKILDEFRSPRPASEPKVKGEEELTERELEVIRLIAKGMSNKEIAGALNITENTVKVHVRTTLEKLHLNNRVQAAVYAVKEGLLDTEKD
jgi:two-component system nitrate/nitrite response regulator NarL